MIRKIKLSRREIMRIQELLWIVIIFFLIIGIVSASDPSMSEMPGDGGTQEQLEPQQITPDQGSVNVGQYFGYENADRVKIQALGDDEQQVNVNPVEGGGVGVSGIGDFSINFYGKAKDGEEPQAIQQYTQFKQGEEHTLVFDEKNQLTTGTEVTGTVKDDKPTKITIGSQTHKLFEGDKLTIKGTPDGRTKETKIVPQTRIERPEQAPINEEVLNPLEEPDFTHEDFETSVKYEILEGKDIKFKDDNGNELPVNGNLYYKGDSDGGDFYHKQGEDLTFGGIEFQSVENQGEWTRIITDTSQGIPKNYKGSLAVLDKNNGVFGVMTNTQDSTPVLIGNEENRVFPLPMEDEFQRFLALQATGKENGASGTFLLKSDTQGDIPTLHMFGEGAKADVDDKHVSIKINPRTGKPDLLLNIKNAKLNPARGDKTLTFPMRIRFNKDDGETPFLADGTETPLAEHNFDLWVNGHRQFSTLERDVNWQERRGVYQTKGSFRISPRWEYNYLHPDEQKKFFELPAEDQNRILGDNYFHPGRIQEELEQTPTPEPEQQTTPEQSAEDKAKIDEWEKKNRNFLTDLRGRDEEKYNELARKYLGESASGSFDDLQREVGQMERYQAWEKAINERQETPQVDWNDVARWGSYLPSQSPGTSQHSSYRGTQLPSPQKALQNIVNVARSQGFDASKNKNGFFVKFGASWCGPCQQTNPIYDSVARQYEQKHGIKFMHINVDPHTLSLESLGIFGRSGQTIPAYGYFKDGKFVSFQKGTGGDSVQSMQLRINEMTGIR
jgi:thiol-disulfide isomerase/thioredoxin